MSGLGTSASRFSVSEWVSTHPTNSQIDQVFSLASSNPLIFKRVFYII